MSTNNQTTNAARGQGNPQTDEAEIRAAKVQVSGAVWVALIGGIVTVLTTLIGVLAANGYFSITPTPTPVPTEAPVVAMLTASPTLTDMPPTPRTTNTQAPTDTIVPTRVENTPVPCEWQAYSDGELETFGSSPCLGDVIFGNIGISEASAGKVDFSVNTNLRGIYGMVMPLGPVQQIKRGSAYTIRLNIKELTAAQFIVGFGPNPRYDVQGAYAIVISPDGNYLSLKYRFFRADGYSTNSDYARKPSKDPISGINYMVKFTVSYPTMNIEVDGGNFKPIAEQISFDSTAYLFIGYQRISSQTARTRIDAQVELLQR
jgi:hypothetical protein